ncbi:hypothetical protein P7K49_009358 [Saguinus oedipus]|uniref:Uncharacterized protein n=1 Tax=Saguinus oedipus TaxID=9490 RepID=A0ABQ9VMV7_SAGOE|nr:hypothetical protein P7K49_009358 [Saguinus oedipus]
MREDFVSLIARTGGELADQEQAVRDGQYAFPDENAGGGLGGECPQPRTAPKWQGRLESVGVVREGQGDPEDGRNAGRARLANTEKRVFLKEEIRGSQLRIVVDR